MGRWTLLACLLGLFNLWCALVASRDSFSVSEEELLGVLRSFITLSWLGLLGKGMASRGGWLDLTTSLVALGPSMVQVLVRTQNCLCWP